MVLRYSMRNILLVILAAFILSACAAKTTTKKIETQITGDTFTGSETVKYLATGVPDRVFFATNKSILTTASRDTLRKQATWLRENKSISVTVEGHADERGTREYNLALGARRSNSVKEYLVNLGVDPSRVTTISYGKERPIDPRSVGAAWSINRNAHTAIISGASS